MDIPRRTHPLIIVAAVAVSLFSIVGIGAVMGWIPTSVGQNSATVAQAPEQTESQPEAAKPVERHAQQPKRVARAEPQRRTEEAAITPPPPPPPAAVAAICRECGVIEEVRTVEKPGQASGVGAVGGAFGGNQVEKEVKKDKQYQTVVRYDDGSTGTFTQTTAPAWHRGDRVRVINGAIQANG